MVRVSQHWPLYDLVLMNSDNVQYSTLKPGRKACAPLCIISLVISVVNTLLFPRDFFTRYSYVYPHSWKHDPLLTSINIFHSRHPDPNESRAVGLSYLECSPDDGRKDDLPNYPTCFTHQLELRLITEFRTSVFLPLEKIHIKPIFFIVTAVQNLLFWFIYTSIK